MVFLFDITADSLFFRCLCFMKLIFFPGLFRWPVRSVVRSPVSSVTLCLRRWPSSPPTRSASPSPRSSASQSRKLSATERTSTARSFLLRLNFISVIAGKPDHKFYKTIKFTFYLYWCSLFSLDYFCQGGYCSLELNLLVTVGHDIWNLLFRRKCRVRPMYRFRNVVP